MAVDYKLDVTEAYKAKVSVEHLRKTIESLDPEYIFYQKSEQTVHDVVTSWSLFTKSAESGNTAFYYYMVSLGSKGVEREYAEKFSKAPGMKYFKKFMKEKRREFGRIIGGYIKPKSK